MFNLHVLSSSGFCLLNVTLYIFLYFVGLNRDINRAKNPSRVHPLILHRAPGVSLLQLFHTGSNRLLLYHGVFTIVTSVVGAYLFPFTIFSHTGDLLT